MNDVIFTFPSFTRKAITFTMDDGNLPLDEKFIKIVRPAGIKGTFNLIGLDRIGNHTPESYREFYRGFEIANHCKEHPKVLAEDECSRITDAPFSFDSADTELIYKTKREGVYYKFFGRYWGCVATPKTYIKLVDESKEEMEGVFGKGSITAFVWPYCEQNNEEVKAYLASEYKSVRKTGISDFNLPSDRMAWIYNAIHSNLLEKAKEFDSLDNFEGLRYFCFGVHPHDFENSNNWCDLEAFAEKYGSRPEDFYYATVGEIFDYEDALSLVSITDAEVVNNSDITVYMIINGVNTAVEAKKSIAI